MSFDSINGFLRLLVCLVPFLFVQRWLHREIQAVFLLLTRNLAVSLGLFAILFLPGVFLHEISHFLAAKLLRVRTGDFSLLPNVMQDGRLRLGYVEAEGADVFREALIGAAPLIAGGAVIALLGTYRLGLTPLVGFLEQGAWSAFFDTLLALPDQPDFWVWFYFAFVVSSTMLPSESDRHAWLPLALVLLGLLLVAVFAGAGGWMVQNLLPRLDNALGAVAIVFGISLVVHLFLALPIFLIRKLLNRLTGLEVG